MRTVRISDEVWDEIAKHANFGDSVDDVLRRVFGLASELDDHASQPNTRVPRRPRRNRATNRMSSHVSNGRLIVDFASGHRREFKLPQKTDKSGIRLVRDEACLFADEHDATLGQLTAVKKALTDAGYYVSR